MWGRGLVAVATRQHGNAASLISIMAIITINIIK